MISRAGLALAASAAVGNIWVADAMADGTPSGTPITNSATLDFQVGGVDQDQITSNIASFVVDNRVIVEVTTDDAGGVVPVAPGAQDQILTYTVTNAGNTVQDYSLSLTALASDDFDATAVSFFVDDGDDVYTPGTDTATFIDELGIDGDVKVFVVGDIPTTQTDGQLAEYDLIAQTAQGGTGGAQGSDILTDDSGIVDNPATIQIVFADAAGSADGANDGASSSRDAYEILSAALAVAKSSAVISDPVNLGVNPKAIPGATVRYTITVTNTGSAAATDVVLVDGIPPNTVYDPSSITLDGDGQTDGGGDDDGDHDVTNSGAVTVTIASVAGSGGTATVTFDVVIS
jgi:uncharacterized repeat protein (TIGR01451 family)